MLLKKTPKNVGTGRVWKSFEGHDRRCLSCLKQNVHRNMANKNTANQAQKEMQSGLLGTGGRGSCYAVEESLTQLPSAVQGKTELVRDEPGCVPMVISKQSVEGTASFPPAAYVKCERREISYGKNC